MNSIRAPWLPPARLLPVWLALCSPLAGLADANTNATPPAILLEPRDLTIAQYEYARFEVRATGSQPLAYQWQTVTTNTTLVTNVIDGHEFVLTNRTVAATNIDGATKSAYLLRGAGLANAGGYQVVITNVAGAVTSRVANLGVFTVATRELRAASVARDTNGQYLLPIRFYPLGNERTISGSLNYAPGVIVNPNLSLNPALTNVTMEADLGQSAAGLIGMTFHVPPGIVGGSTTLTPDDFLDLPTFASSVQNRSDPVSSFINDHLSDATRTALNNYTGSSTEAQPLLATLVPDLNVIIAGPSMYDPGRFANVVLRADTEKLLAENPTGGVELARLNRLLFEDAYPLQIGRAPNPLAGVTTVANLRFDLAEGRTMTEAALAWGGQVMPLQVLDATNAVQDFNAVVYPTVLGPLKAPGFNPQSGVYTQVVALLNPGATEVRGARISVSNLGKDTRTNDIFLANAVSPALTFSNANTLYYIPGYMDTGPLAAGAVRLLTAEYYVSDRRTVPAPTYEVSIAQATFVTLNGTNIMQVDRALFTNDTFLVEFKTISNYVYYVQYNWNIEDTNSVWQTALPGVLGTGGRVQWMDNGMPKTESVPRSTTSRFYRVIGP